MRIVNCEVDLLGSPAGINILLAIPSCVIHLIESRSPSDLSCSLTSKEHVKNNRYHGLSVSWQSDS